MVLQSIITGLLLGGIYAAYSAGFSLIFGVMGVVNIAHGELVMLGAFISYWMFTLAHIDPFISIPFSAVSLFIIGYVVQRLIINRVVDAPPIMSYICTFGIHLIIANLALRFWTADYRSITTSYCGGNLKYAGLVLPYARLATFGMAVLMVGGLYLFLSKTDIGRAIQATAQDREMARLMGVRANHVYAITFGLGAAITGVSGSLVSTYFVIYPQMGLFYTVTAFSVVVLGGMGYIPGALLGGVILGVLESLTATFWSAGMSSTLTFFVLFLMLIFRPAGITGKGIVE